MDDITFNFLRMYLVSAILSIADKSHGLFCERLGSGNSQTELNCTVRNTINDINITSHEVHDACSTTDNVLTKTMIALDSASFCIGHNTCVLTDKMTNVSNSGLEKTWKLVIQYYCVHTRTNHHHPKNPKKVCPFKMESIACGDINRKIEIKSVGMMPYSSDCEKPVLDNSCIELIHQKVNTSCNGKQNCEPRIWNQSVFTWDDCIRIPKFYNISFSCVKEVPSVLPLQIESNVEGVAVGVTVGLIIVVGVVVVYMWFVRRRTRPDDKHNIANRNDKNDDYIGNQNVAMPANCNSEMSTNELRNDNNKGTNEGKTVNDQESNSETRISGQIRSYSNLAIYSTVLEASDTGCPVQDENAYNYEMAKPINESKYDKHVPTFEKDNYAFNEDQYDVSGKHNGSAQQQVIYSRAVDTVYDSTSHNRQNNMSDETYDHAFGPTTEDDYDIAKH
ncbi:uncharacterized protein LOC134726148 [Mytilus trossulus]|uniref:uncharacterized protein LOC134726148 n=1 Tax=Mytilus trossulus TaxID=6551 RepID=UPI0030040A2F